MEVFGIGPLEIVLIVLIAFIVLGPDRIPEVMRQLGTWLRQLRELTNNITRDYGSDIQQLTGELNALQTEFRNIQRELSQVATGFITPTMTPDPKQKIAPPNMPPAQAPDVPPESAPSSANLTPAPTPDAQTEPANPIAPSPAEKTSNTDDSFTI